MKLWRWEHGRQKGGYSKLLLASSTLLKFDVYILSLPEGSVVKPHTDPCPSGFEHHRLNVTLVPARLGGDTYIEKNLPVDLQEYELERRTVYHFRPDLFSHYVTPIRHGRLLMLSIGWLRKIK